MCGAMVVKNFRAHRINGNNGREKKIQTTYTSTKRISKKKHFKAFLVCSQNDNHREISLIHPHSQQTKHIWTFRILVMCFTHTRIRMNN